MNFKFTIIFLIIFVVGLCSVVILTVSNHHLNQDNNGNCIDGYCIGDVVVIKATQKEGYISGYYRWKPSVKTQFTITYANDIGEVKTVELTNTEFTSKD